MFVALLGGWLTGLIVVLAYAYGTAELLWPAAITAYLALLLVFLATSLTIAVTAMLMRRRQVRSRVAFVLVLAVSALVMYTLCSAVRLYPPAELPSQLPGYLDASPSLGRWVETITSAEFPVLDKLLTPAQSWIYLGVEGLLLLGVILAAMARSLDASYCQVCRRFTQRTRDVVRLAAVDRAHAMQYVMARNWILFRGLPPPKKGDSSWLRMDLASCPTCKRMHTLSMILVRKWWRNTRLARDIRLTDDDVRTVKGLARNT